MAAYTLKSDKIFLRCMEMGSIEVYELDGLYINPVKQKNWSHLRIRIGTEEEYEALKIGHKEIRGTESQTLIEDLYGSRLTVNREGLCFLAATRFTTLLLNVEYYRIFDLFDWSKYHVKTSLNTTWVRRDFVSGRPLDIGSHHGNDDESSNENLGKKEKELEEDEDNSDDEEEIEVLRKMFVESEIKWEKELDDKGDIIEAMGKMMVEAERKREKELNDKQEEIDKLEKKLAEAEIKKEFLERLDKYYFPRVQKMQLSVPSSKITISFDDEYKDGRTFNEVFCAYIPVARIESESLMPKRYLKCGKTFYSNFDLNNWKVLQVEDCLYDDPEIRKTVMYYYAGGSDSFEKKFFKDMETVPIPCHPDHLKCYHYWDVRYILGIGTRLTI